MPLSAKADFYGLLLLAGGTVWDRSSYGERAVLWPKTKFECEKKAYAKKVMKISQMNFTFLGKTQTYFSLNNSSLKIR